MSVFVAEGFLNVFFFILFHAKGKTTGWSWSLYQCFFMDALFTFMAFSGHFNPKQLAQGPRSGRETILAFKLMSFRSVAQHHNQ